MPRLWSETIETHRESVREAIVDAAARVVAEHGPWSVTMSQIAERTGIGRATLYRYFPDVEAILLAWHERQVARHLQQLAALRDRPGRARERLDAVLHAYARIQHERVRHEHDHADLAALVHRGEHMDRAQDRLHALLRDLLAECQQDGDLRDDIDPRELAAYCLHALSAAADLPSAASVGRLVTVILAGLSPRS